MPPSVLTPREQLTNLTKSGNLPGNRILSEEAINRASELEVANTLMLVEHSRQVSESIGKIANVLDDIQSNMREQDVVLAQHGLSLKQGEATMATLSAVAYRVDETTKKTNGRVDKHDVQIAEAQNQIKALMEFNGQREAKAIEKAVADHAVEAVAKGVWMIPKPTRQQLWVIGGFVAFIGCDRIISVALSLWKIIHP